jgi:hypothetical protein
VTCVTAAGLWLVVPPAAAQALDPLGARAIGRAGASAVADDGATALPRNPAALARRTALRVQVGTALRDDDTRYAAGGDVAPIENRSGPVSIPFGGIVAGWGPVVAGIAYVESGERSVATPTATPDFEPLEEIERLFPHRHAATALRVERRALVAGAALRATSWLAVGASVGAARVELDEARDVWAGFSGITPVGDPSRDLALALSARDAFVPDATMGLLFVPPQLPVELALAASYSADAHLDGTASLSPARDAEFPRIEVGEAAANVTLPAPVVLRAGIRTVAPRLAVELGGELALHRDGDAARAPAWQIDGLVVEDDSGVTGELTALPASLAARDHLAARAAVELEIVRDFAWLTAGYAYTDRAVPRPRLGPGHAELATHTIAVGAEGYWGGVTVAIGYARSLSAELAIDPDATDLELANPFPGGTRPAAAGTYDRSADTIGISLEVAWEEDAEAEP